MRRESRDSRLTIMVAAMVCDVMSDLVFLFFMRAFIALPVLFFGMELGLAPCQAKAECSNDSAK